MRIVLLSPSLPYPGGRADGRFLTSLLAELSTRGIDVTCVSSHEESDAALCEARTLADARGYELIDARLTLVESYLRRKAASARRPFSEHARSVTLPDALEAALRPGYDVLQVEDLFLARAAANAARRVVYLYCLEAVDLEGRTAMSARERVTRLQYRRATISLLRSEPRVVASTERLAHEVARWHRGSVPTAHPAFEATTYPASSCDDRVVGVIGSMFWYPSRSAAERVLRRLWAPIRERVPDARLLVAGWQSDRYLARYFPLDGAELLGPVGDPSELFGHCSVVLYPPPRGTGVKVKVLEAMARNLVVVSNGEGLEGLPDDAPVLRGESDAELVGATVRALEDPQLRAGLRAGCRTFFDEHFTPASAADHLLDAYSELGLTR
jgi:glycosyltransferase involved in cell wall biosynthesis